MRVIVLCDYIMLTLLSMWKLVHVDTDMQNKSRTTATVGIHWEKPSKRINLYNLLRVTIMHAVDKTRFVESRVLNSYPILSILTLAETRWRSIGQKTASQFDGSTWFGT